MNHDDHGWVDPADAGVLKQALGAMAGGVDPASATGPAATLPAMSRRVRRRRTVKAGGLGGGALALVGALVLGAAQLAPPDTSEVPPGSGAPELRVQDGYQPPWLAGTDLTCGMPAADLETTAPGWSVAVAGDLYTRTAEPGGSAARSWGLAATYREGAGSLETAPVLVWSQDGEVVDLGPSVERSRPAEPLLGGGDGTVEAVGGPASTCAPSTSGDDPDFETPLPAGEYEVRVVALPESEGRTGTVVSDAVRVRLDVDGAHVPGTPRTAGPRFELPEPVAGQVARFELDRTTDEHTATLTRGSTLPTTPMRVLAVCASTDPEDLLPVEVVRASTGDVIGAGQVTCDGHEAGSELADLDTAGAGEPVDLRLSVPDGASRVWVSFEPATPVGGDDGPECSARGYEPDYPVVDAMTQETWATAGSILVLAQVCDADALAAYARQHGAELMDGAASPEETFALPETDRGRYRALAGLVGGTTPAFSDGGADASVTWPRVVTPEFQDSDESWAELVAAGVLTQKEADAQRVTGYTGPRVGITVSGDWLSYTTGE
ncbi:hypothetical protein ACFQHV_23135 [Promicromonospora thailandica]|uniref:Uncharacterized protein n=1 Tax=Promicromonospora thailandica TaxID=765201 RepID=A0A9X2FYH7_9MICO|nr:hypothetical protein [Promicromonospora thailandica]MCP2263519.1 hypothetical protein [Promicromonospora thailandica]BFF19301.1 hypothetical protein GCM10025730_28220 [Promicromonospora thailandica]